MYRISHHRSPKGALLALAALLLALAGPLQGCTFGRKLDESADGDGDGDGDGENGDGDSDEEEDPGDEPLGFGSFESLPVLAPLGRGQIAFYRNDSIFTIAANGSQETNLSRALDPFSTGIDERPGMSRNGDWFVFTTGRFESAGYPALVAVRRDLAYARLVIAGKLRVHPDGRAAINNAGTRIIFPAAVDGAAHIFDLYAIDRVGNERWSEPVNLTAGSSFKVNQEPVLHADETRFLFDCGNEVSSQSAGNSICEINVDGSNLRTLITPAQNPLGPAADSFVHRADYAPGNTIVFEADWAGEEIWRRAANGNLTVVGDFSNDNSPCVLPNGDIATLWLDRPGGTSLHEIKVMSAGGVNEGVITPNQDVSDVGLCCGGQ